LRKRPFEWLYNGLVKKAKEENKWSDLSYEEFLEFTRENICFYCWKPVAWAPFTNRKEAYNLDRKNNKGKYTKTNLVVCCFRCNQGKSDKFSFEEWNGMTEIFRRI